MFRLLRLNSSVTARILRAVPGCCAIFRQLREPDESIGEGYIVLNHAQKMIRNGLKRTDLSLEIIGILTNALIELAFIGLSRTRSRVQVSSHRWMNNCNCKSTAAFLWNNRQDNAAKFRCFSLPTSDECVKKLASSK